MHKVLVKRLGGLSLPRKSVVRLTDRPDMTFDVYRGRKTTMHVVNVNCVLSFCVLLLHTDRGDITLNRLLVLLICLQLILRKFCNFY